MYVYTLLSLPLLLFALVLALLMVDGCCAAAGATKLLNIAAVVVCVA